MSYDRTYICTSKRRNGILERRQAATLNLSEHFEIIYNRLQAEGNYVVLVAGGNSCIEEQFLFVNASLSQEFYDRGFLKWETFIGDNDEGSGFAEVSLYQGGQRTDTKSYPPSKRIKAKK